MGEKPAGEIQREDEVMKYAAIIVSTLVMAVPVLAQDETTIELSAVPAPAMEAAQKAAPRITFETANMDEDEGTATYELSGKMSSGMAIEVDVLADGTVEEIEEQIDSGALPTEVKAALDKEMAGFAPTMIEKSTRPDGTVIYEFEGTHDGKDIDAEINADGTGYQLSEDMAG